MRLLRRLKVSGLLSFGPKGVDLPLEPLNVLVGPNGSGKSNLLEAIALLRSAASELAEPIGRRDGPVEVFWKGTEASRSIRMEACVDFPPTKKLQHSLEVKSFDARFVMAGERVEVFDEAGQGIMVHRLASDGVRMEDRMPGTPLTAQKRRPTTKPKTSLLRFADPNTDLGYLREQYEAVRLYRNWSFGPDAPVRAPCGAHGRSDFLDEGGANLALVLSQFYGEHKQALLDALRSLYEGIMDFQCPVTGGTVRLILVEKGNRDIPATLLSDGTLRYLCLLAVLLHPQPPPLICIEEPELGLHPDLLPTVSDLICDASERTQLVVTTHSDVMVDTLTEQPESVVICEKHDGETEMHRLDKDDMAKWLKDYRLGDLWIDGELGGKRW